MAKKAKKKAKRKKKAGRGSTQPLMDKAWQAQDDLRTLRNADEIASDQKRMAAAQREADKELEALQRLKKKKKK